MARKDILTKTCTKTQETFTGTQDELAEFFYRDKSQKDGLSPWCKAAEKAYNKAYFSGLKKANAQKKALIEDEKDLATFERVMKGERVKRGKKDATRTPQSKARTTARRKARSAATKKAQA